MSVSGWNFHVLGIGHLAAAVRVQLRLCGLSPAGDARADENCIFLACSDYERTPPLFPPWHAGDCRRGILPACIAGTRVRLGPLVVTLETAPLERNAALRHRDFSPGITEQARLRLHCISSHPLMELTPATRLHLLARLGALLVTREVYRLRFSAPDTRLIGHVIDFDPVATDDGGLQPHETLDSWARAGGAAGFPPRKWPPWPGECGLSRRKAACGRI